MKDLLGQAIFDYQTNNSLSEFITETDISEQETMDIAYLFRSYEQMPKIEQKALDLAKGKILDVGAGAGAHSFYLQNNGHDVTAIDISIPSIEVCKIRGIEKAFVEDILKVEQEKFDTILLLMNGTGIFGKLKNISTYLQHLKNLLTDNGQILIDSCDLIYMFDTDQDGSAWIPMGNKDYYGELEFTVSYKGQSSEPFPWLYVDYNTLQNAAHANGLTCELIIEGDNYDYLAKISKGK